MRVLLIDDSLVTRQSVRRVLSSLNVEREDCIEFSTAEEGMQEISQTRFDLVITAGELPGMNGLTFVKLLKMHPLHSRLPVILITETAAIEDIAEAMQVNVTDCIAKPFRPDVLRRRLDSVLTVARVSRRDRAIATAFASSRMSQPLPLDVGMN